MSGEAEKRGRGRPREVARPLAGSGLPLHVRLADMSHTSQAILAAARDVAIRRGVAGFTLRAVADEAHVDLSTVKYHFESKAGLLEALLDSLYRDDVARFVALVDELEGPEARLEAYFRMAEHDLTEGRDRMRLYYELECQALRDPLLARRFAAHNRWLVEALLTSVLGPEATAAQLADPACAAFWAFLAAVIDGASLHNEFDPEHYPLRAVFGLLREMALSRVRDIDGAQAPQRGGG